MAGVQYSAPDFCRSPGAAGHYPGVRFRMDEQGAVLQRLSARQQLFPEHRICRPQPARRSRAGPADADENELPPELFSQVYQPPVSRGDGFDRANLLKADALLNAAGWTVKNQRRVNAATGKPLRFELLLPAGAMTAGCCRFSTTCSVWGSSWIFVRLIIRSTATAAAAGITT